MLMSIPPAPLRVLVCDDVIDYTETMSTLLRLMTPYDIRTCNTGEECVEMAVRWCPHVILLDIYMPGGNGFGVAREVRAAHLNPRPLLIAVSGNDDDRHRKQALSAGFDLYFQKPVGGEILCERIKHHVLDANRRPS